LTLPLRPRLAVLIDAENIPASHAPTLVSRIAQRGRATVRRAYGDWTHARLTPWEKLLVPLAIRPQQEFRRLHQKGSSLNAADSALVMDAMELIHMGCVEGICIVSSNPCFIALATRIHEAGLLAYGFGLRGTPAAFMAACSEFVVLDAVGQGATAT
jgi:hypothetical protein